MIRVVQSRTGSDGTCFRACLASILELSEADVPDFTDEGFFEQADEFLADHGLRYRRAPMSSKPSGYSTVEGISPRGGLHACVALDGELVWDPHPIEDGTGQGLVEPRYYGLLEPILGQTKHEGAELEKIGVRDEDDIFSLVLRRLGLTREEYFAMNPKRADQLFNLAKKELDRERRKAEKKSLLGRDRADMLQLRKNTERQGGPFFMQETTKSGRERTIPVKELSKGADTIRLNMGDVRKAVRGWERMKAPALAKVLREAEGIARNLSGPEQSKVHDLLEPLRETLAEMRADGQDKRGRLHKALDHILDRSRRNK